MTPFAMGFACIERTDPIPPYHVHFSRDDLYVREKIDAALHGAAPRPYVVDRHMVGDRLYEVVISPAVGAPEFLADPEDAVPLRVGASRPGPALGVPAPVHVGPEAGLVVASDDCCHRWMVTTETGGVI